MVMLIKPLVGMHAACRGNERRATPRLTVRHSSRDAPGLENQLFHTQGTWLAFAAFPMQLPAKQFARNGSASAFPFAFAPDEPVPADEGTRVVPLDCGPTIPCSRQAGNSGNRLDVHQNGDDIG
jgi:hypothetical protein